MCVFQLINPRGYVLKIHQQPMLGMYCTIMINNYISINVNTCIFTHTLIQLVPQQEAYTARGGTPIFHQESIDFMHSNLHPQ